MKQVIITNEAEREAVLERSRELTDRVLNLDEQREIEAIAAALEAHDTEHAAPGGSDVPAEPKA